MRQRLEEAERDLGAAEAAYGEAKQASRDAADAVKEAKARLTRVQAHEIAQPIGGLRVGEIVRASTRRVFVAR